MSSKIDITKLDLYGLFEVPPDASIQGKESKTTYRKKGLQREAQEGKRRTGSNG